MNPNTRHDIFILHLIANASVLVQVVMLLLLLASLFSWYYIFLKYFALKRATALANEFEKQFWSGADLNDLHQRAMNSRTNAGSMRTSPDPSRSGTWNSCAR